MTIYIYWRTHNRQLIEKIRRQFGIPKGITLNGETELPQDFDFEQQYFEDTRKRGFFDVRYKNEK